MPGPQSGATREQTNGKPRHAAVPTGHKHFFASTPCPIQTHVPGAISCLKSAPDTFSALEASAWLSLAGTTGPTSPKSPVSLSRAKPKRSPLAKASSCVTVDAMACSTRRVSCSPSSCSPELCSGRGGGCATVSGMHRTTGNVATSHANAVTTVEPSGASGHHADPPARHSNLDRCEPRYDIVEQFPDPRRRHRPGGGPCGPGSGGGHGPGRTRTASDNGHSLGQGDECGDRFKSDGSA